MQQVEPTPGRPSASYASRPLSGHATPLGLPPQGAGKNWKDEPEGLANAQRMVPCIADFSPIATGRSDPRSRQEPVADLAARLQRVQQRQQARFAALPLSMKEDFHILLWHQHRLRANQAAHDAALARLERSAAPQS